MVNGDEEWSTLTEHNTDLTDFTLLHINCLILRADAKSNDTTCK